MTSVTFDGNNNAYNFNNSNPHTEGSEKLSQLFQEKTANFSSVSAGAAAGLEFESKVRAAKVEGSLANKLMPSEEDVYEQLSMHYLDKEDPDFPDDKFEVESFRKELIKAAFRAFKDAGIDSGFSNDISAFRFKEIMLASDWKFLCLKDPKIFDKLFNLAIGKEDPNRKKIDIVELAYIFIWLGKTDDKVLDPQEIIQLYHFIFIEREHSNVKIIFKGVSPIPKKQDDKKLYDIPKPEDWKMSFRLSSGKPDKSLMCIRNLAFDNTRTSLSSPYYFQKLPGDKLNLRPYPCDPRSRNMPSRITYSSEYYPIHDRVNGFAGIFGRIRDSKPPFTPIPEAPKAPFPKLI